VAEQSGASRLKVFISYSRHDSSGLVEELVAGLELLGFEPFLDRHDIAGGEDWEARLATLIQAADTVVFVISPAAVGSERCAWEVQKSIELSKRLIPIVGQPVADTAVPDNLRRLNYIFFGEGHSFARSLGLLSDALKVDLDWVREHTRLAELAARWRERKKPEALLLRGDELDAAQAWIAARKPDASEVTDAQRAFITASADAQAARENQERRQLEEMAKAQAARAEALNEREMIVKKLSRRTTIGLVIAAALSAAAIGLAYWATQADQRFRRERERAEEALSQSVANAIERESMRTDIMGQLSAFAAAPGQLSQDGPAGGNSPYTQQVLAELTDANSSLMDALTRAHRRVLNDTGGSQRPYLSSDLNGTVYLRRQPADRKRIAILAHIDKLPQGALANVERDAVAWRDFLETCGFKTVLLKNPDRAAYRDALAQARFSEPERQGQYSVPFVRKVGLVRSSSPPPNTLLLFFYSGAGGYQKGMNYLMARDADLSTMEAAPRTLMPLSEIQDGLRNQAAASIVILDTNFTDVDRASSPPSPR
jgi:uncharacterized caspase-like protein